MAKKISTNTPLTELTLRKYEHPTNLSSRELVKRLCLSLGLLQPGDSRDVIVDVLLVLLKDANKKKLLNSEELRYEVVKERKKRKLPLVGIASSNIRRQLRKLKDLFLVEKVANDYRIAEKALLTELFEEKIEQYLLPSLTNRIKEHLQAVDNEFLIQKKSKKIKNK